MCTALYGWPEWMLMKKPMTVVKMKMTLQRVPVTLAIAHTFSKFPTGILEWGAFAFHYAWSITYGASSLVTESSRATRRNNKVTLTLCHYHLEGGLSRSGHWTIGDRALSPLKLIRFKLSVIYTSSYLGFLCVISEYSFNQRTFGSKDGLRTMLSAAMPLEYQTCEVRVQEHGA